MCVGCKIGIVQAPVYKVNCAECKIGPCMCFCCYQVHISIYSYVCILASLHYAVPVQCWSLLLRRVAVRDRMCFCCYQNKRRAGAKSESVCPIHHTMQEREYTTATLGGPCCSHEIPLQLVGPVSISFVKCPADSYLQV